MNGVCIGLGCICVRQGILRVRGLVTCKKALLVMSRSIPQECISLMKALWKNALKTKRDTSESAVR